MSYCEQKRNRKDASRGQEDQESKKCYVSLYLKFFQSRKTINHKVNCHQIVFTYEDVGR